MSTGDIAKSPKRRPPQTGTAVLVRVQPDFLAAIDDWRREQPDLPSRSEAIRRLVGRALGVQDGG